MIVEVVPIHWTGISTGSIIALAKHRNDKTKMELIVTLHGQHAATLDVGDGPVAARANNEHGRNVGAHARRLEGEA